MIHSQAKPALPNVNQPSLSNVNPLDSTHPAPPCFIISRYGEEGRW
jgi:hypothetical protein